MCVCVGGGGDGGGEVSAAVRNQLTHTRTVKRRREGFLKTQNPEQCLESNTCGFSCTKYSGS